MVWREGGTDRFGGAGRSLAAIALLTLVLVSCEGKQVVQPVDTGVVWTRLTPMSMEECLYPDFRADSLVFDATGIDGRPRLAVSKSDGTGSLVLNYPGPASWIDFRPRWIGSQLVVYQSNVNGTFDIWYRDLTTDSDRRLTDFPTNESAPAPRPGSPGLVYVEYDNTTATTNSADLRGRLVLIPDTASVPLAKIFLTPDTLRCGEPDWDPTGTKLVFSVEDAADLTRHIYTMNLAPGDSVPVRATTGPTHDFGPRWSPDGKRIAFTSDRTGRWGVWLLSPLGEASGLQLVSFEDKNASVYTPTWTPDGANLVVSSDGRGGVRSLWLLSNLPAFKF